jgi:hypothetical protein
MTLQLWHGKVAISLMPHHVDASAAGHYFSIMNWTVPTRMAQSIPDIFHNGTAEWVT